MSRLPLPTCQGSPRCPLGSVRLPAKSVACRARLLTSAQRQPLCPGLLLSAQPGRRVGLCILASCQNAFEPKVSLLAPLPKWCQRLAGAFVLVPFLVFGGSRNAVAQPVGPSLGTAPFQVASIRANPLYETGFTDIRTSPQARAAAALAVAMVGYGFVRSGGAGATSASVAGQSSSNRALVAARGMAVSAPPLDAAACSEEELYQLSRRLTELELRNEMLMARARELMEADASLGFVEATFKAAETLDMDVEEAEAFIAANANTARLPPSRPSGGASRGIPVADVVAAAAAAAVDVTAAAAAAVAAEVQAGVPVRPSGGASRLTALPGGSYISDTRVPMPERPGGASARSGPPLATLAPPSQVPPPPPQPDSSRVTPRSRAGDAQDKATNATEPVLPPPPAAAAPPPSRIYDNPLADGFRPSLRPTRRGAAPRAPRMYRAIAPPPLPPPPPPRINPSFDVPEDAPSPEEYLRETDGRTSDGRLNPSFASTVAMSAVPAAAEPLPAAPAPVTTAAAAAASPAAVPAAAAEEPVWYNPLSWFTQRDAPRELSRTGGTNPSFDSSLAVDVAEPVNQLQLLQEQQPQLQSQQLQPLEEQWQLQEQPPQQLELQQQQQQKMSLVETLVAEAEEQADATGEEVGVGAAAAASSAAWSEALTEGAVPGDYTPVEQVSELLEVVMRTEEFTYPKYDPLRNALAGAAAPSAAHKYDMIRSLLREGQAPDAADASAGSTHKYDLVYDLLQSVRTSGDPDVILSASDPKYDPVWCLLNMREPTAAGSLSKYDLVGSLLKAALEASPQPGRYDPLQVILQAKPITGSFKYCLAEVLLHGGWQLPLESGLVDLPFWDPMSAVVGSSTRESNSAGGATAADSAAVAASRRTVSKYDMVGQAMEAVAALPEDLASGKWAASQPRDPFLGSRARVTVPRRRQRRSKYDMVGQALDAAAALPEDLASGKWAASQGRELFVDTVSRAVDEGSWGLWRRLRNGGAAAVGAVTTVVSPVSNLVAKAVGLPYEVAPGVVMKVERSSSAAAAAGATAATPDLVAELPMVLYTFKSAAANGNRSGSRGESDRAAGSAVRSAAPAGKRRQQRVAAVGGVALPPATTPPAVPRLERAVVPPLRSTGRRVASGQSPPPAQQQLQSGLDEQPEPEPAAASAEVATLPHVPSADNAAVQTAMVTAPESPDDRPIPSQAMSMTVSTQEVGGSNAAAEVAANAADTAAVAAGTAVVTATEAVVAATAPPEPQPPLLSAPQPSTRQRQPAPPMTLSELAVDLLVFMSVQGSKGSEPPSMAELVARFGDGFTVVAAQLQSLRGNGPLMGRHPAVARLVRAASKSAGDGKGMWSHLYDMLGAVRDAELAMPAFLEDCRMPYPLVHGLLTTGDIGQSVSVLCTLCNLLPPPPSSSSSSR